MTAIHVDRYMFTVDEVVAAILPNIGRARELEMRIDTDGYVVIDIVAPVAPAQHQAPGDDDDFPGDQPSKSETPPAQTSEQSTSDPAGTEPGPREEEARNLCRQPLFRAFLEVKTEEAALKVLVERCHVKALSDL